MATEQYGAEHDAAKRCEAEGALGPQAEQDLELSVLARAIAGRGHDMGAVLELLRRPFRDAHLPAHRYSLLDGLYQDKQLQLELERILPTLAELSMFRRAAAGNESQMLRTIWRLGELELYVDAVERLHATLSRYQGHSGSVGMIAEQISSLYQDELFAELRAELPRLQEAIRKRRSVTIGINLDERLRPIEAALLSINSERISERSLLGGFLARLFSTRGAHRSAELRSEGSVHYACLPRELAGSEGRSPLTPLFRDLETLLDRTTRPVQHALERYLRLQTRRLALQALDPIQDSDSDRADRNEPTKLDSEKHDRSPNGAEPGPRTRVVTNTAEFGHAARAFILTGPNHGGKTTYTQAVGMAFVLAQAGFFVPAASAVISPADRIETHFPAPEAPEADGGRLAEEVSRLAQLFDTVTPESLVLLNESLASTGTGEAAYIAEDLLRGLCIAGCRTIFATHLHEPAAHIDEINSSIHSDTNRGAKNRGDTELASLVAAGRTHERPFSVVRSAPVGRSFAHEIAEHHGMSLETIRERLRRRNIL